MAQAEVNPFSDASVLQSVRIKLKGACYRQSKGKVDIRMFFPTGTETTTLGEFRAVVRKKLHLAPQFLPDPAITKLVGYLSEPALAMYEDMRAGTWKKMFHD